MDGILEMAGIGISMVKKQLEENVAQIKQLQEKIIELEAKLETENADTSS